MGMHAKQLKNRRSRPKIQETMLAKYVHKRRMKIVELGGAKGLVNMLAGAKDDKTRKLALKALVAISKSDGALDPILKAGVMLVIEATPDSSEFKEIEDYKTSLMARLQDMKYDTSSY
ncbi:hypothetical protein OROMI_024230 [Orobanche minor]